MPIKHPHAQTASLHGGSIDAAHKTEKRKRRRRKWEIGHIYNQPTNVRRSPLDAGLCVPALEIKQLATSSIKERRYFDELQREAYLGYDCKPLFRSRFDYLLEAVKV